MVLATIILTQKCPPDQLQKIDLVIELTAEERQKSRQRIELADAQTIHFNLPRGTHIHAGNYFQTADQSLTVQVQAKPEAVLTVKAEDPILLLKAAYHLGNRHVPLEVAADYLRFAPDHVLQEMLENLGIKVMAETVPFFPEEGAYGHHH